MGGGLATAELAAAGSRAGGLGTIGFAGTKQVAREVRRARELAPRRPVAVNLLLPFRRPSHIEVGVVEKVDAVVLFFGFDPGAVARLRLAPVASGFRE